MTDLDPLPYSKVCDLKEWGERTALYKLDEPVSLIADGAFYDIDYFVMTDDEQGAYDRPVVVAPTDEDGELQDKYMWVDIDGFLDGVIEALNADGTGDLDNGYGDVTDAAL